VKKSDELTNPASCICSTPERDGTIRHSDKMVTFRAHLINGQKEIVTVCWHHRKLYSGWKSAKERKEGKG
jgi:nitrate reductase beta subunit